MHESFSCDICFEPFQSDLVEDEFDRRPAVLCMNGHTFCMECCGQPQVKKCPNCRGEALAKPILNISLSKV